MVNLPQKNNFFGTIQTLQKLDNPNVKVTNIWMGQRPMGKIKNRSCSTDDFAKNTTKIIVIMILII